MDHKYNMKHKTTVLCNIMERSKVNFTIISFPLINITLLSARKCFQQKTWLIRIKAFEKFSETIADYDVKWWGSLAQKMLKIPVKSWGRQFEAELIVRSESTEQNVIIYPSFLVSNWPATSVSYLHRVFSCKGTWA